MMMDVRDIKDPEIRKLVRQERNKADNLDLFGEKPPAALMTPYPLSPEGKERSAKLQQKYVDRARNIERCWNRIQLYLPELLTTKDPHRVLEMSTAHGAMLEILRHYGHDVVGNDFANMVSRRAGQEMSQFRALNDETFTRTEDDIGLPIEGATEIDWPYRHIVESIGLPMKIFDAGHVPYPFEDKQFDVIICSQAIEHYCHPTDWMPIVDEFCRLSRKTVFVLLNRLIPEFRAKEDYNAAFTAFRHGMRAYDRNGFHCVASFVHWDQALGFKLMAK